MVCTGPSLTTLPPTTGGPDTTPPAAPNNLIIVGNSSANLLSWNNGLESDLAGYDVYSSATLGGSYTKLNGSRLTSPSYADTAATVGSPVYYKVYAVDTSGNQSNPAAGSATRPTPSVTPPDPPANPMATGVPTGVLITWDANIESDLAGYNLFYSTTIGGTYVQVNGPLLTDTTYVDTSAPAGVAAYYYVEAVNSSNLSSDASDIVNATPQDVTPPAVPTGLLASADETEVVLVWDANTETDLDGYNVYSAASATGIFTQINGSLLTDPTYTDSTITAGQTLYYAVTAMDTSGNQSAKSAVVFATRSPGSATPAPIAFLGVEAPAQMDASLWGNPPGNGYTPKQCRYVWNAGDPSSAYNIVESRSPQFSHFYQSPGTYTLNCTRIDPDLNQTPFSVSFTIQPSSRTQIYVDAANGLDTNQGTSASPLKSVSAAIPLIGPNSELLLKRGQVFNLTGASGDQIKVNSNTVFRDYGDAAQPEPVLYILMPTTSGPLIGNRPVCNFLAAGLPVHVRFMNLRVDSNAVPGSYTSGGKTTTAIDPRFGSVHGRGIVFYNVKLGNLNDGIYLDGAPDHVLVQGVTQVGSDIPNHFCWGQGSYITMLGCTQVQTSNENGTRFADDGSVYVWLHDCTFGKTVNYKASLVLRTIQHAAITNCTMSGANFGITPHNNLHAVDDVVIENCVLKNGARLNLGVGTTNCDWHNLIIDMGTASGAAMSIDTTQADKTADASAPGGFDHYFGMPLQNQNFYHCTFITNTPSSKAISLGIGTARDSTDAVTGKNYPSGLTFINCLMTGLIVGKNGGAGLSVNDTLQGNFTGFTAFSGNSWPIINYSATTHSTSLGTDTTHVVGTSITNTAFGQIPAVSFERYAQVAMSANYHPVAPPTAPMTKFSRYDFDGQVRASTGGPVANPSVYVGARAPVGAAYTLYVDGTNGNDSNDGKSPARPFKTLSKMTGVAKAGDVVSVAPGIYRESLVFTNGGTTSQPIAVDGGALGSVIIDGADLVAGWAKDNSTANPVYYATWTNRPTFNGSDHQPYDPDFAVAHGMPEAVAFFRQFMWQATAGDVANEVMLVQLVDYTDGGGSHPGRSRLSAGKFYVDDGAHIVYVWLPSGVNPTSGQVWGSTRQHLLRTKGYTALKNLVFRHSTNSYHDAMCLTTTGDSMLNIICEKSNAAAYSVDDGTVSCTNVTCRNGGQMGFAGHLAVGTVLTDCTNGPNNNYKGFSHGGEAVCKFSACDNLTFDNWHAYNNAGNNTWFDPNAGDITFKNSKFDGTGDYALVNEIACGKLTLINCTFAGSSNSVLIAEREADQSKNTHNRTFSVVIDGCTFSGGATVKPRALPLGSAPNVRLPPINVSITNCKCINSPSIVTDAGVFVPGDVTTKNYKVDHNDYTGSGRLAHWGNGSGGGGVDYSTIASVRTALHLELSGTSNR